MGFETHFLKAQITVILNYPVKVVRAKALSPNQLRLGLADISESDRAMLESHALAMMEAFPTQTNQNMRIKGLFPTQNEIDESGRDLVFFTADKKLTTLFDKRRRRVSLTSLPHVSVCRVAVVFTGMKTKGNEVSFMTRIHQLKLVNANEDRLESSMECLFDYSTDSAVDDEDNDDTDVIEDDQEMAKK
jgi:hypothetical protein